MAQRHLIASTFLFFDLQLEDTFGSDLRSLNSPQFNLHYDWLPGWKEIPKHLGEMLDQDYLNNRDVSISFGEYILQIFLQASGLRTKYRRYRIFICVVRFQLDQVLLNAYEHMQTFAVGIEQIVWDQEDYKLRFRDEFKDAEFKLRGVSCFFEIDSVTPF